MTAANSETETETSGPLLMNFASRARAVGALRVLGLMGVEQGRLIASAMDRAQRMDIEEGAFSNEVHAEVRELARKLLDTPPDSGMFCFTLSYDG